MKKIGIVLLILFVFLGIIFGYIQYKKSNVENSIIEYLTTEKSISKDDIISSEPFISNLPGDKNWMVGIKLINDDKTYFYYKSNKKVILESFSDNGVDHVQ